MLSIDVILSLETNSSFADVWKTPLLCQICASLSSSKLFLCLNCKTFFFKNFPIDPFSTPITPKLRSVVVILYFVYPVASVPQQQPRPLLTLYHQPVSQFSIAEPAAWSVGRSFFAVFSDVVLLGWHTQLFAPLPNPSRHFVFMLNQ